MDELGGNRVRGIHGDNAGHLDLTTLGGICKFDGYVSTTLPAAASEDGGWRLHPGDSWFLWFRGRRQLRTRPTPALRKAHIASTARR
ncbi:MAG: hypothetical protein AB7I19_11810 [Planctomycetota bacterium]